MHVTAIIAAAGAGRRLGAESPKQFLELAGRPMIEWSVEAFALHPRVQDVIVVVPPDQTLCWPHELDQRAQTRIRTVAGGERRQDSVANAFAAVSEGTDVVLVHDAARPFVTADLISRSIDAAAEYGAAIVAQPVRDTVKRVDGDGSRLHIVETLPRESIFLAQTPQAFRRDVLRDAVMLGQSGVDATDEATLAERAGHAVHIVEGTPDNVKITTPDDLAAARRRTSREFLVAQGRIGTGYDLHRLVEGRRLVLGGIDVPSERGALGHSDADVICHAATDAILGACSLGDIGRHFPDSDPKWKGASSIELLRRAVALVHESGFRVVNLDVVVLLEQPKIGAFIDRIRQSLASVLETGADRISVKGKTNEGVDAVGRGEAIAAHAVALLASAS
jgi:2-C-methyl-D-erythritol 4-phosphate cytidylyltransferase / 2-C-methyl-D-erythritol 2,4-cyclodiphosphate synthase